MATNVPPAQDSLIVLDMKVRAAINNMESFIAERLSTARSEHSRNRARLISARSAVLIAIARTSIADVEARIIASVDTKTAYIPPSESQSMKTVAAIIELDALAADLRANPV